MLDALHSHLRHESILGRWVLRGLSEDQGCLMLRRAELGKERLRWGNLHPEAVSGGGARQNSWLVGSQAGEGTLVEEAENFLLVLAETEKMRSLQGRPPPSPPQLIPCLTPERETGSQWQKGWVIYIWHGSAPPPSVQIEVLLSYGDASVRPSGNLAKSKWLSLVTVVS